jgi:hypothetical protein
MCTSNLSLCELVLIGNLVFDCQVLNSGKLKGSQRAVGKTPRLTRGGVLPWWVRKRLQERSGASDSTAATQPEPFKPKKKLPNNVQVNCGCVAHMRRTHAMHCSS